MGTSGVQSCTTLMKRDPKIRMLRQPAWRLEIALEVPPKGYGGDPSK